MLVETKNYLICTFLLNEGCNKERLSNCCKNFNLGVFGINLKSVGNTLCSQKILFDV